MGWRIIDLFNDPTPNGLINLRYPHHDEACRTHGHEIKREAGLHKHLAFSQQETLLGSTTITTNPRRPTHQTSRSRRSH